MSLSKGQDELSLTESSIAKLLLYLSLPIVITNPFQTTYNLTDMFWFGQYSTEALTAISFAFPMVFLLILLGVGLSIARSIPIAQHTGAEEIDKVEYAASQTAIFTFLGLAMLGAFGHPFVRLFLDFPGASPDVLPGATAYMQIIAFGLLFMFGFFAFILLMRGAGDTITPMLVMFETVVLNIVLDPLLINGQAFGPIQLLRLGIQNATVTTVISQAPAMVVGIVTMVLGSRGTQVHLTDMQPDFRYLWKILHTGIPTSVEGTGRALSINTLFIVVRLSSTSVVATSGTETRMSSIIFLLTIAATRSAEMMSGQNIGAGRYDRVEQANYVAVKGLFFVLDLLGVAIFLVPEPTVSVFVIDVEVLEVGAEFL